MRAILVALVGGAQETVVGSTATLVGITKEMALWDTPFLFGNAREADAILDGPIGQKVMDKLQDKGLVGLAYRENGVSQSHQQQASGDQARRPGRHQAARDAEQRLPRQLQAARRERRADAVLRTVQCARDEDRGRPGEPVQHDPVEQVL